jgi:pimeloyl-ACP methyl ester carboxylesterase
VWPFLDYGSALGYPAFPSANMPDVDSPDELRALVRLGFAELGGATRGVRSMHSAIARRAFTAAGPGARPARGVHDAVAGGVYATVAGGIGLLGRAADLGLARRRDPASAALSDTRRGAVGLGVLNGFVGDSLDHALHQPMGIRVWGRAVPPEPGALAEAFPDATTEVAVFVHGLAGSELAWRAGGRERYAVRLRRDLGLTPVELRYNSGLHISENGRALAGLLDRLVAGWPRPVERIALVGHSMGGLVARSACHLGAERGDAWVTRVRQTVSLGSPHTGAPLAQGVHWAAGLLHALPETRPVARLLQRRSAGIRDLRQGSLVDEDWRGRDPHALAAVACQEVPLLEGARHAFVAGTITQGPFGRLLGDCLVLEPSASGCGPGRRLAFDAERGLRVGGAHHLALLNHPLVYERLRDWLSD